ncbi:hypothetical protein TSUD_215180 [Trifolium subterraneum]|uniref:Uncharacterized protein n=1 Tax=Trifolium subterraneum TaxID=3900 RepID=A0A2Z6NP67_TRISU|nr:hypothetical protein TSUD_215180 [Trifolium subterraneum]
MSEALLGVVFDNLLSLLQNEFSTISGIKSKAENLSTTLDLIKVVIEDAEQKQVTNHSIKVWLQQLKDAVYVLDDIFDECSIQSNRLKAPSFFNPKNIVFRHAIGKRLKEITRRFDQIAESKNKFPLQEGLSVRETPIEVVEWRQTSSFIVEPKVYGREDDKENIVRFLLGQARDFDFLSIYPIFGLGGVGKTTLAELVYNDHRVSSNFQTKIWVCVSEVFSIKRIFCSIIESITREKFDALDLDVIEREMQELLHGKRYLLVLDDIWNKNQGLELGLSQDRWNKLKSVLSCRSKGASILVTTRDKDVAEITGTRPAHHLIGLSENECWLLFKQYEFGRGREEQEELVAIGKEIVKKCGGLPLAAQALGSLMRSRREEKEWLEIKESRLWTLSDENSILPALRLSYFHLTPTLKRCFAFCAIFPKDMEIVKEDLIHLWIGNGFIFSRANLDVEDVGNMIWNELCHKSFFQDIKIDDYSGDTTFKIHDLVHDLAQSVMGPECMILENTNTTLSRSTHHASFYSNINLFSFNKAFKKAESLRTFYKLDFSSQQGYDYFPTNRSLRVLSISTFKSSSFGNLIHLRYLELRDLDIVTLPNSIYCLHKLDILKLKFFRKLSFLPEHLTCLQNLRHLVIEDCRSLSRVFPYIGKLSCLRTLSVYFVRPDKGYGLGELHDLMLGGKLSIQGLRNVGSLSEARQANLMGKKDLQELCLSWRNDGETVIPATNVEQLLEVLQPHSNLKRLKIFNYDGSCFPKWIGFLNNLVDLQLRDCNNCVLSSLGKLPSLRKLELYNMHNIKYVDDDDYHDGVEVRAFPSLEKLLLVGLKKLERLLKVEIRDMFLPLSNLTIIDCPKFGFPCLPSLKNLIVFGCNIELLMSISSFRSLTTLHLTKGEDVTSFPEGMLRNLTCLQNLKIANFPKLKKLPNEPFSLTLEHLSIYSCGELESIPEQTWESLRSLQSMDIGYCGGLRSFPESIRHLTSLEFLKIRGCPTLKERCTEGSGEDWDKIAHIPKLYVE